MFETITVPELDDECTLALNKCIQNIQTNIQANRIAVGFYNGEDRIVSLGIALPKFLKQIRPVTSWASIIVDSLEERLDIQNWTLPGTNNSQALEKIKTIWTDNCLNVEAPQAHKEALIHGVSFTAVTRGGQYDPDPVVTVESPFNTSGIYDSVRRDLSHAVVLRNNDEGRIIGATFFTRNETIQLEKDPQKLAFEIADIDYHGLNKCMVERIINNPRPSHPWGSSEITRSVKYYTLGAMRTLCRGEVASELFATPQRYILGIEDFGGDTQAQYNAYMGHILGIPDKKDDYDYKRPELGEFSASSPQPFIDMIKCYAQLLAGESALPPQYLGFTTENPASADQIRAVEARHVKKAERRQTWFGTAWVKTMKNAYAITGADPADLQGLNVVWADASTPTRAATTDAIVKQVQTGILPATSEITLEQLGYDAQDIQRVQNEQIRDMLIKMNTNINETDTNMEKKKTRFFEKWTSNN